MSHNLWPPNDWRRSIHFHLHAPTISPRHNSDPHQQNGHLGHNPISQSAPLDSFQIGPTTTALSSPLHSYNKPLHFSPTPTSPPPVAYFPPPVFYSNLPPPPSRYTPMTSQSECVQPHKQQLLPSITATCHQSNFSHHPPISQPLRHPHTDFPITFGNWNENRQHRATELRYEEGQQNVEKRRQDKMLREQPPDANSMLHTGMVQAACQRNIEPPRHTVRRAVGRSNYMEEKLRRKQEIERDAATYLIPSTSAASELLHRFRSSSGFAAAPVAPVSVPATLLPTPSSDAAASSNISHASSQKSSTSSSITDRETFCSLYSDNDYGDCWQELQSGWHYGLVIDFHSRNGHMLQDNTPQEEAIQFVELYTAETGRCFIPTTRSRIADKARNTEMVRFKQEEDSQFYRLRPPCFRHQSLQGTCKVRPGRLFSFRPVAVCGFHRLPLHQAAERQLTVPLWVDQIGMLEVDARLCLKLKSKNSHTDRTGFFEALRLLYVYIECDHNENPQAAITPAQWRITNAQVIAEESNIDSTPSNCWPLAAQRHDDLTFHSFDHTETPWLFRSAQFPDRHIWARAEQIVDPETCLHAGDKPLSAVIVPIHFGTHKGTWQCLVVGLKEEVLNVSKERLLNFKSFTLYRQHRAGTKRLQQIKDDDRKNFQVSEKNYVYVDESLLEKCPEEMQVVWTELVGLETN